MENSTKYFANKKCEYFPCHEVAAPDADFNCMFCYCPMYSFETCIGKPVYLTSRAGKRIKDCSNCTVPHQPNNYDKIMQFLKEH